VNTPQTVASQPVAATPTQPVAVPKPSALPAQSIHRGGGAAEDDDDFVPPMLKASPPLLSAPHCESCESVGESPVSTPCRRETSFVTESVRAQLSFLFDEPLSPGTFNGSLRRHVVSTGGAISPSPPIPPRAASPAA